MPDTNPNEATISRRASKCYRILREYFEDDPEANLVELLIDAMHWCDQIGNDFGQLFEHAYEQYRAETGGSD